MRTHSRTRRHLALGLMLSTVLLPAAFAAEPLVLTLVHGLSFSADGRQLITPSHHGLAAFADGRWSKVAGPAHDYMGYSATRDAVHSSGHPAPGGGLTNPFGLIKSTDGGRSWSQLGLAGESDFHVLATSYRTNAVSVINQGSNARMNQPGIHSTRNDGLQWARAGARGLGSAPRSLAVHPDDAAVVAAGTSDGLYLSRDSAGQFDRLVGGRQVLAQTFDLDAKHLWFSAHDGQMALMRIKLRAGARPEAMPLPTLSDDAEAYIAQNPSRPSALAIATFNRDVYVSTDGGRRWTPIAREGVTLPEAPK